MSTSSIPIKVSSLSIKDAVKLSGADKFYLYRLIRAGKLQKVHHPDTGRIQIRRDSFDKWLAAYRQRHAKCFAAMSQPYAYSDKSPASTTEGSKLS